MVWVGEGGGCWWTTCCGLGGEGGTHSLAHTQRKVGFDICEFVKGSVVCVSAMGCSLAVGYSVLDYVIVPEIGMYNKTFRGPAG